MVDNQVKDNVIRQNIPQDPENPVDHLNSGYEGQPSLDFTIPPCGIEDVDRALHRLFDKTIGFKTTTIKTTRGPQEIGKPFVIFATGERFAVAKSLHPPRDKKKVLILPAISIRRTTVEQASDDINKRGMNQFTGNMVIKKRLSPEDRDYQNLINKDGIKNLQNVLAGLPQSSRRIGDFKEDIEVVEGGLLRNNLSNNNIYEIISIPQPQFFTATYEVVFWTGFSQHMTYMIEAYMSSFLPQSRGHKLQTDKGYWFITSTEDSFTGGENFSDDFSDNERVVRYTFTVKVKGYVLAAQGPAGVVPVRRWISSPNIVFDLVRVGGEVLPQKVLERPPIKDVVHDGFTLTDIDKDPQTSQTPTTIQRFVLKKTVIDAKTGKRRTKYVSITDTNQQKGETSYSSSDIETLEQFITAPK